MKGEQGPIQRALDALEQAPQEPTVSISLFGAGPNSDDYQKRLELAARLKKHPDVLEVVILEEELDDDVSGNRLDEAERLAIKQADLVIGVQGPDPAYGLTAEIHAYLWQENAAKWLILWPTDRPAFHWGGLAATVAQDRLSALDSIPYDPEWWVSCEHLTSACADRVEKIASRKRLPGSPPISQQMQTLVVSTGTPPEQLQA